LQKKIMPLEMVKRLWTVDEVLQMVEKGILPPDNRLELIRGELIEMSPGGLDHSATVNHIITLLIKLLEEKAIIWGQTNVPLDKYSAPEPDVAVLKYRKDSYFSRFPGPSDVFLFIEVAGSSLGIDRKIKAPLYAEMGIPEYWIVDLDKKCVEVYQKPENGKYSIKKIYRPGEKLVLPGLEEELEVEGVFGPAK